MGSSHWKTTSDLGEKKKKLVNWIKKCLSCLKKDVLSYEIEGLQAIVETNHEVTVRIEFPDSPDCAWEWKKQAKRKQESEAGNGTKTGTKL